MPSPAGTRRDTWQYTEYTGEIVGREIAERWYHTGVFVLNAADKLVEKFLDTSVWGRGVVPADAVRRLRIDVVPEYKADDEETARVMASLAHLKRLSSKNTEVVFNVTWRAYRSNGNRSLFEIIRDLEGVVRGLRIERGFGKVLVRQNLSRMLPEDITEYCYVTKKKKSSEMKLLRLVDRVGLDVVSDWEVNYDDSSEGDE